MQRQLKSLIHARAVGALASFVRETKESCRMYQTGEDGKPTENKPLLKATYSGILNIGDIKIPCAVLEDGSRVLSEFGITTALKSRSGASKRHKKKSIESGRAPLPVFVASENLIPFISDELHAGLIEPVKYKVNGRIKSGFSAVLLPEICDVWLKARDAEVLNPLQEGRCKQAEILVRGLAHIGIIALVDEATGYQQVRERNELNEILKAYISEELMQWTKRFPDEFYKQMFRLWEWPYPPTEHNGAPRGPRYAGKLTKQLIYNELPPGIIDDIEKKNPPNEKGQRRYRHHQWLTDNIGNPHLEKQVSVVTTLMKISPNRRVFMKHFEKAFSTKPIQEELFPDDI